MTRSDAWLLVKKISIGILITVVPLAIIAGGLWTTQRFNTNRTHIQHASSTKGASREN